MTRQAETAVAVPTRFLVTDGTIAGSQVGISTAAQVRTALNVEDGATADQTNAEIKTAYEANADTNAFLDAEKTKLTNIAESANNYVHPNHSGDVTSTADGATAIAAGVIVDADVNASAAIALSKLATQAALSVVANATNDVAVPTALAAASDHQVLRRSGTAVAFGTIATDGIAAAAVTNAKLANMAEATFKMRAASAGTGDPIDGTATQARTALNVEDGATADQTAQQIATLIDADATAEATLTAALVTTAAVTTAGALMDSEVDADLKTLSLPASTTISAFGATLVDDADAEAARTTLGAAPTTVGQGQQHFFIPAGSMIARTTSGPDVGAIELETNDVMLDVMGFDWVADEHAQFAVQMPKRWNEGTIVAQFIWSHPTTTVSFGVAFFIQARAFANADAGDAAFGTAVGVVDTGTTADAIYISPETDPITVTGDPGDEEYVIFQVYRDVSDAGDTLETNARLHGVKIHYTSNAATDD